ncbi:putative homeodomain transcription factor 2 isoform X2 [Pomacea canaliculata]|uniref:putative homeodomain transcription factor 2 isoform X2 n=1 Tax=Pomacea canaliculata TaxID=400727 RepID=UPI000D732735|nr:putative homeodomain transcription factor 2 isoform X2 [Pomacea canaliculata]
MERIHNAIAWYQKKIGSYDKQLWEQSVEKKLQKGLASVHRAPRKTVRLKTEFIDVDLIRGSTFTKTKPQVPWIYITRKAFVRVLFFPFYYRWWVRQTSWKVFIALLFLYIMQVVTTTVYFRNVDGSIIEDELALTEVMVPISLMFLLGLIHSQTVLAHFSLKPPRRGGHLQRKSRKRQRNSSHLSGEGLLDSSGSRHHHHHHRREVPGSRLSPPRMSANSVGGLHKPDILPGQSILWSASHSRSPCQRERPGSERCNKKNVRIADQVQSFSSAFRGEAEVKEVGKENERVVKPIVQERRNTEDNVDHRVATKAFSDPVNVIKDISDAQTSARRPDKCCVHLERSCVSCVDKVGCETNAGTHSKSDHSKRDSTEEDSLSGKFEIVNIDSHDNRDETVEKIMRSQSALISLSSSHDKSSTSDLETTCCLSLSHITDIGRQADRNSMSEDTCDQKDEDNLSDAGLVSNSSNYNPSDSGPESEPDNLEDEELPRTSLAKSVLPASETVVGEGAGTPSLPIGASLPPSPCLSLRSASLNASPRKVLSQQQQAQDEESSASDPGSLDARQTSSGTSLRRRRRVGTNQANGEGGMEGTGRARFLQLKLPALRNKLTQTSGVSSSENEAGNRTPDAGSKATISSEEWEDRMQSDMTTSSSYSTSNTESELSDSNDNMEDDNDDLASEGLSSSVFHGINLLQPPTTTSSSSPYAQQPDKVSCVIWEGNECKKVDLTALDIGWAIIDKVDNLPESSDYIVIGMVLSVLLGIVPLAYRAHFEKDQTLLAAWQPHLWIWGVIVNHSWRQNLLVFNGMIQRLVFSGIFFFLLTVTDRTFKQRLLYAKHFSYLTSSRRARKFDVPHFRLNKVRNIKIWLSLRSYLKRRGPQRSVDVIVSAGFYCTIILVCLMSIQVLWAERLLDITAMTAALRYNIPHTCLHLFSGYCPLHIAIKQFLMMLKETETYLDNLCNWELVMWCIALGIYIMRFMTLGLKINKKYRNLSVLITEQINLYLQMEQKPHKKEDLILANNVVRLAQDLLKELESPFKISGFSANPLIYNIAKLIVLSAFSTVMTELLGFKLKLYKIKLKG